MFTPKQYSAIFLGLIAAFFVWQQSIKNNLNTALLSSTKSFFNAQIHYQHYQHFMNKQQKEFKLSQGNYTKNLTQKNITLLKKNKNELLKKSQANTIVYDDNLYLSEKLALLIADYNQHAHYYNQKRNKVPFKWVAKYYQINAVKTIDYENIPSISI